MGFLGSLIGDARELHLLVLGLVDRLALLDASIDDSSEDSEDGLDSVDGDVNLQTSHVDVGLVLGIGKLSADLSVSMGSVNEPARIERGGVDLIDRDGRSEEVAVVGGLKGFGGVLLVLEVDEGNVSLMVVVVLDGERGDLSES